MMVNKKTKQAVKAFVLDHYANAQIIWKRNFLYIVLRYKTPEELENTYCTYKFYSILGEHLYLLFCVPLLQLRIYHDDKNPNCWFHVNFYMGEMNHKLFYAVMYD